MDTRGGHRQLCIPKFAHVEFSLAPQVHQRNPWIINNFSLRIDREQHVSDSSNHSLYLIKLLNSSSPEGHCGGNQQLNGSVCLSPPFSKYIERFAREYLLKPPLEFLLTLPCRCLQQHQQQPEPQHTHTLIHTYTYTHTPRQTTHKNRNGRHRGTEQRGK